MGQNHGQKQHRQINRKQRDVELSGNQTKQGRHETGPYIGAGHLNPDDRLRALRAEVVWMTQG